MKYHRTCHSVQKISDLYQYCDIKQHTACWDDRENNVGLEQMAHVPFSFISSLLSAPDYGMGSFIRALTHEPRLSE